MTWDNNNNTITSLKRSNPSSFSLEEQQSWKRVAKVHVGNDHGNAQSCPIVEDHDLSSVSSVGAFGSESDETRPSSMSSLDASHRDFTGFGLKAGFGSPLGSTIDQDEDTIASAKSAVRVQAEQVGYSSPVSEDTTENKDENKKARQTQETLAEAPKPHAQSPDPDLDIEIPEICRSNPYSGSGLRRQKSQLAFGMPPLNKLTDIYKDMTSRAIDLGLDDALSHLGSKPLRVVTMCSGTESPLLALEMVQQCMSSRPGSSSVVVKSSVVDGIADEYHSCRSPKGLRPIF